MQHNEIQEENKKYLIWLKKPICLTGLIYLIFYLWFVVLAFLESFLIGLYGIFFNSKININENIAFDIEYFLSFLLAILLVSILYRKTYKDSLIKTNILKISIYLSLISLIGVKVGEGFTVPFSNWTIFDIILADVLLIVKNFIMFTVITYVSDKIAYKLKDFNFAALLKKIIYRVCIIGFIIILIILDALRRHHL